MHSEEPIAAACPSQSLTQGARQWSDSSPIHGGEPYYLIAELDWDDMPALQRGFQTPEGRATADDVANLAPEGKVRSMIYELEDALR